MIAELVNIAIEYLDRRKTISDVSEWLTCIDWDEGILDSESKKVLGRFELLITEINEGLRPEAELMQEVSDFVMRKISITSGSTDNESEPFFNPEPVCLGLQSSYR